MSSHGRQRRLPSSSSSLQCLCGAHNIAASSPTHRLLLLYDAAGAPLPRRLVTAITARSQRAFYCLPQLAAADTGIFAAQHTGWVRKSKLLIQANMSIQLRR